MTNKLFFLIFLILFMDIHVNGEESKEEKEERELEDLESDMVIALKKFKKTKEEEKIMRDKLCERNLKASEWEKLSRYCFEEAVGNTKCAKCKELFIKSFEYCNKKVPQTDGCNEITFNKRGSCQVTVFEDNRKEMLYAYRDNREDFISVIAKINDCYAKTVKADFKNVNL